MAQAAAVKRSERKPKGQKRDDATQRDALEVIRAIYEARVARAALVLRPGFERGELRGATPAEAEAPEGWEATPLCKLEDRVWRLVCGGNEEGALVTLLCSPNARAMIGTHGARTVEAEAVRAASSDVLRYARGEGWYRPVRGEFPSNRELRSFPARRRS